MEVPLLVNDFLRRAAKLYGPAEAVVNGDLRLTWSQFNARVNQQANALRSAGIGKGDRGRDHRAQLAPVPGDVLRHGLNRRGHRADELPARAIGLRVHAGALRLEGGAGRR